ncbi:MAG: hypothetical protein HYS12_12490 [Planctomycetes bacterium]|nr:hypothetical protein [Planctomycetota bacterium]
MSGHPSASNIRPRSRHLHKSRYPPSLVLRDGSGPSAADASAFRSISCDGLGRTTKLTDPAGKVTCTVYKDTNYEVRTYRGWDSAA